MSVDIRKESDMNPAEWLASMRKRYGLVGNVSFPDEWLDDIARRIPRPNREAARHIWERRRSMSAADLHDELMRAYLSQIVPVLRADEKMIADATFFGILPTFQFNAYAGFTPRGDRVVILHQALTHMLCFWSHWYLRMKDEGGSPNYLYDSAEKLLDALSYVVGNWMGIRVSDRMPDIYPKTSDSWRLDDCLVMSAITFVIGHEIGHIKCGHTGYVDDRRHNHGMEFEADRCGLSVVIRHTLVKGAVIKGDTYHTKFMLFGPLFALAVMSLLGDQTSDTHPSASERRAMLLVGYEEELKRVLGDRFDEFLDDVDRDVFGILERNSRYLFALFSDYRELIQDVKSVMRMADMPWLRNELANFWS
jgi:hypothetical protein